MPHPAVNKLVARTGAVGNLSLGTAPPCFLWRMPTPETAMCHAVLHVDVHASGSHVCVCVCDPASSSEQQVLCRMLLSHR